MRRTLGCGCFHGGQNLNLPAFPFLGLAPRPHLAPAFDDYPSSGSKPDRSLRFLANLGDSGCGVASAGRLDGNDSAGRFKANQVAKSSKVNPAPGECIPVLGLDGDPSKAPPFS